MPFVVWRGPSIGYDVKCAPTSNLQRQNSRMLLGALAEPARARGVKDLGTKSPPAVEVEAGV